MAACYTPDMLVITWGRFWGRKKYLPSPKEYIWTMSLLAGVLLQLSSEVLSLPGGSGHHGAPWSQRGGPWAGTVLEHL